MSQPTTPAERRRPKLEVALEQLVSLTSQLQNVSVQYQQMKHLLESGEAPQNVGLMLIIGNSQVPMPLPADAETRTQYVEEAASFLGQQVVSLWQQLDQVVSGAAQHCAAAAAQAAQAEQPVTG